MCNSFLQLRSDNTLSRWISSFSQLVFVLEFLAEWTSLILEAPRLLLGTVFCWRGEKQALYTPTSENGSSYPFADTVWTILELSFKHHSNQCLGPATAVPTGLGDSRVGPESLLNRAADYNLRMSARWKSNVKVPRSLSAAQLIHCDCFHGCS